MSSTLENLVTCAVCLRRFSDPRVLPCQHTFCLRPCLETIYNPNIRRIRCPLCREDHLLLKGVASSLPVNRTIQNLLEISPSAGIDEARGGAAEGPSVGVGGAGVGEASASGAALPGVGEEVAHCTLCRASTSELVRCEHCETQICPGCLAGHQRQVRGEISRSVSQLRRVLPQLTESISLTGDRLATLESNQGNVMAEIARAFDDLGQLIEQRRREVIEEADTSFTTEMRRLRSEKETLEVDVASLSSVCQCAGDKATQPDARMTELMELRSTCLEYVTSHGSVGTRTRSNSFNETQKRARFHHDLSQLRTTVLSFGSVLWIERSSGSTSEGAAGAVRRSASRSPPPHHSPPLRQPLPTVRGVNRAEAVASWHVEDDSYLNWRTNRGGLEGRAGHRTNRRVTLPGRSGEETGVFLSLENPSFRSVRNGQTNESNVPAHRGIGRMASLQPRGRGRPLESETRDPMESTPEATGEAQASHSTVRENGVTDSSRETSSEERENISPQRQRERTFVLDRLPRPVAFEINADSLAVTSSDEEISGRYADKGVPVLVVGERGNGIGQFCWPRGVAVTRDNPAKIVVADSSNHRVQIFSISGEYIASCGSYGTSEGEFECLSGVAVDGMGQVIAADRYNHRLVVFNRQGRFVHQWGEQGVREGQLSYPWGVATDQLGFLYVCDKDNHRVQVFAQNGTYVRQFGSHGRRPGQLENPHYLAVSSDGRVYVSDTSNHRVQVFDQRGHFLFKFGGDGPGPGQMKFPRGIAIDEEGYVVLADSGNNRIQVFTGSGQFVVSFGAHGSGQGQFKGLEGLALTPDGKVVVCDRDNHRIQVF